MIFRNVTIELNGMKEVVFNRTTVWVRTPNDSKRWVKYKIAPKRGGKGDKETSLIAGMSESDLRTKILGGMSEQEMHDILEHHMQNPAKYEVGTSGFTINVRRVK